MLRRTVFLVSAVFMFQPFHPAATSASNCSGTSTGLVPLTDLGTGLYQGYQGGLYAGGSNLRPGAHHAAGVALAGSIVPLDTLGNPGSEGRVVLISIGMSNCTQEFSFFVLKAINDPLKAARVVPIDCAKGGQAAEDINTPTAAYWDTVFTRLRGHGSSPLQAQVVWLKEANRAPNGPFSATAESLLWNLGAVVRIIKDKLPNVRQCYIASRIYGGYASTSLNPEPYAYESGFAVKWLIDSQISGEDSLNFDPAAGAVEAPWLSWGPYLWADGLTPRSDGMIWRCEEFVDDGTHPSWSGRDIVADSLLAFFRSDETTAPWYRAVTVSVPRARDDRRLTVSPNPACGDVQIAFAASSGAPWRLDVVDLSGRRIREAGHGVGSGVPERIGWDLRDQRGARVPGGVYWIQLDDDWRRVARPVVVMENER